MSRRLDREGRMDRTEQEPPAQRSVAPHDASATDIRQISGRNDAGYRRRVGMDVIYARRRSVGLYLSIPLATAPAVLLRRGAS